MPLVLDDPDLIARIEDLAGRLGLPVPAAIGVALDAASNDRGFAEAEHSFTPEPPAAVEAPEPNGSPPDEAEWARQLAKLEAIRAQFRTYPSTGVVADDAFFDSLHR